MTAAALSNELKSLLTRAGVDNPSGDAALIMEKALGCSRSALVARYHDEVDADRADAALALAKRRASGEPIQYVLGEWRFMGRDYLVGEGVLIPRDDTEVVVSAALDCLKDIPSPYVVDLCAGSGIIAITVQKAIPSATVAAVEKSAEAYEYLCRNAALNGAAITAIHSDLCGCTDRFADGSLDMILSNPPYVPTGEIPSLQREVQYEPSMALDGGASGLDFYGMIVRLWTPKLKKGGRIAFELGEGQFGYISELLQDSCYAEIRGYEDIQGTVRAVTAKLK